MNEPVFPPCFRPDLDAARKRLSIARAHLARLRDLQTETEAEIRRYETVLRNFENQT